MSLSGLRRLYRFSAHRPRAFGHITSTSPITCIASARTFPRSFCNRAAIMADDNAVAGVYGAQSAGADAAADTSKAQNNTVAAAATSDAPSETVAAPSSAPAASDGGGQGNQKGDPSNRQKRKDRWKKGWKDKKKAKREEGGKMFARTTKYDAGKVPPPHEGSFANEKMQRLFGVKIDLPSAGKKSEEDAHDATTSGGKEDDKEDGKEEEAAEEKRVPKRKLAMLVSYLGSRYSGFQINSEKRTLHAELELGLYRAGVISPRNFGHPSKVSWSNSARTDKGVHAAAQVCSFKGEMVFHREGGEGDDVKGQLDRMRERANECLPEDVRVVDFERVTRAFCARTNRDKVRYQYMVPSYMLCPREEVQRAFPTLDAPNASGDPMTPMEAARVTEDALDDETLASAKKALVHYRVTPEQMERLTAGLKLFEGTHPFHNYTRRVGANEAQAARYILSFAPLDPLLVAGDANGDGGERFETQWIPLQIVGQSFLLNQIRKMVSAAVDFARGTVSEEQIKESLSRQCRMKVNVAPAQGLFLDRSFFELYNKHKVEKNADRDTLDWVETAGEALPPAVRRIEEFKNEKIIPHIVEEEAKEGNFVKYVYGQDILYAEKLYRLVEELDNERSAAKAKDGENGSAGTDGKD